MKHIPTEHDEQVTLHTYCKYKKLTSFAIPNGGSRHKLEAINLKKEGVEAGVCDYIVMLPNKILFIELKRRKKLLKSGKYSTTHTKTSPEQIAFIKKITESFKYADGMVCYGAREAIKFIEEYIED